VIYGIVSLQRIIGAGVGEERFAPPSLDLVHDLLEEKGSDIVGITQLTHMELDGYLVPGMDYVEQPGFSI
jgi:hypothetical protein